MLAHHLRNARDGEPSIDNDSLHATPEILFYLLFDTTHLLIVGPLIIALRNGSAWSVISSPFSANLTLRDCLLCSLVLVTGAVLGSLLLKDDE